MSDELRLFGTRAVVTTAADGIGEAIVRTFVKQGASVFAVDQPDSGIQSQFRTLRGVTPFPIKLSDQNEADEMITAASAALDGLDVVVNNAALQPKTPIAAGEIAKLEQFIEQEIRIYRAVAQASLPLLEKSPAGRIVNIGCMRSAFAMDGEDLFARAERALAELTRALAAEAGPDGITVNYVQPGAIMTPASRRVFNDDKAFRDYCINRSAAKRLGEPIDVAKVALFLASDDAVFVSGAGIVVDGGVIG